MLGEEIGYKYSAANDFPMVSWPSKGRNTQSVQLRSVNGFYKILLCSKDCLKLPLIHHTLNAPVLAIIFAWHRN